MSRADERVLDAVCALKLMGEKIEQWGVKGPGSARKYTKVAAEFVERCTPAERIEVAKILGRLQLLRRDGA